MKMKRQDLGYICGWFALVIAIMMIVVPCVAWIDTVVYPDEPEVVEEEGFLEDRFIEVGNYRGPHQVVTYLVDKETHVVYMSTRYTIEPLRYADGRLYLYED